MIPPAPLSGEERAELTPLEVLAIDGFFAFLVSGKPVSWEHVARLYIVAKAEGRRSAL